MNRKRCLKMKLPRLLTCLAALLTLTPRGNAGEAPTAEPPPRFEELRAVVRAHLIGITDEELNRAAVDGLLNSLRGKVRLLGSNDLAAAAAKAPALATARALEAAAYLRVQNVTPTLAAELAAAHRALAATNQLTGIILDLRFADGENYAAAAAAADLFVARATPLLDWGEGPVQATDKTNALAGPVAVLVNSETIGAAEALAEVLRQTGTALLLGNTTRGAAVTAREFALENGRRLRIATATVKLGSGTAISTKGVKPDIEVSVSPETERGFLADPYAPTPLPVRTNLTASSAGGTNRPATRRARVTEADLVRARRDGVPLDAEFLSTREPEPEAPVLRDPVLARAVDLLKGLAVVRRARP
jgi:hypothetical protein